MASQAFQSPQKQEMIPALTFRGSCSRFDTALGGRDPAAPFFPSLSVDMGLALLEFKDLVGGLPPSGKHLQKPSEF